NELTQHAIEINIEQSRSLFQVSLLILGALWGLIVATETKARITRRDYPEIWMFVCANLLLVLSFLWHSIYLAGISDAYKVAATTCAEVSKCIPDVLDDQIHHVFKYQRAFLVAGVVVSVLSLL